MQRYLLGIDVGTSGCRAGLFDTKGNLLGLAAHGYPTFRPHPTWAEQNPADWWEAAKLSIREVLATACVAPSAIAGIGAAGQTNGHVLLDSSGRVLLPAIIWEDRRAIEEARWIQQKLRRIDVVKYLGTRLPIDATTLPARMLWLTRNQAEIIAQTWVMLQPKDYLNYQLTGSAAVDRASCKTLINLCENRFYDEYFELLGLPRRLLPVSYEPHGVIGKVSRVAAEETGLAPGTPVVAGCIDAWCGILGSGVSVRGLASDVAGSSEVVTVFSDRPADTTRLNVIPLFDGYILNGPMQAGGDSFRWFKENFAPGTPLEGLPGDLHGYDLLNWAAETAPPGSGGLVFLPYLQGERAPIWDPFASGTLVGLTKSHRFESVTRSILEGVAYAVRHVLETASEVGNLEVSEVRVSGNGASSRVWNQIKADVTGRLVVIPEQLETGVLGAALVAGVGTGIYSSYAEATAQAVRIREVYEPNPVLHDLYSELYDVYRKVYTRLRTVYPQLNKTLKGG
ncbi:MAG: FGGY family carbohydrate kinase [Bacillota bacterium]|nr:FGGY family carbohydrate kinase [Bacillota bacterium]